MKLVTFENVARQSRIGAIAPENRVVDLHVASATYLRDVEGASAFYRLADALVPPEMRALFSGGDSSLKAAQQAFDHAMLLGPKTVGPQGEALFYNLRDIRLEHRSFQKSSFTRPVTFANTTKKQPRPGSPPGHALDCVLPER